MFEGVDQVQLIYILTRTQEMVTSRLDANHYAQELSASDPGTTTEKFTCAARSQIERLSSPLQGFVANINL